MCKKVFAYKVDMCEYMGVMENKQKMENKMKTYKRVNRMRPCKSRKWEKCEMCGCKFMLINGIDNGLCNKCTKAKRRAK